MKKKKSSYVIGVFFLSIIVLSSFTYFLNENRKVTGIESFFKDLSINIYSLFTKPLTVKNELNIDDSLNNNLVNEINSLKKVLELNHNLGGFNYVNATVLSRNVSYWMNNLVIDKGSNSGIKKDNAVITSNGLIGKIISVNKNNSVVKLLTSSTYKVSVEIGNKYGILDSYNTKKKLFIINGIDKDTKIKIGSEVVTSGLGGVFPSGIYIGNVIKIEDDNYGTSKKAYIRSKQDFNDIRYVTVLEKIDD